MMIHVKVSSDSRCSRTFVDEKFAIESAHCGWERNPSSRIGLGLNMCGKHGRI